MGTSSNQASSQQQTHVLGQPKPQKGWLSRWTRKQWSRHWFVLKNGSLTYYRGPAAELCSFLDGVLDLSLIKHIEVPQQEEQPHNSSNSNTSQQQQQHQQSGAVVNFNLSHSNANHQQVQQQQQQQPMQQQQQQEQHFKFTLKMWNGECHLLSAASSSERQLWLAAINSCNNYDDETASSDSSTSSGSSSSSSSSSQNSNISTRSTDVGCLSSSVVASLSSTKSSRGDKLTGGLPTSPQTFQQQQQQHHLSIRHHFSQNAYQNQQQQQKEAELSLEHLASKLKSVVRKRRDDSLDSQVGDLKPTQLHNINCATSATANSTKLPSQLQAQQNLTSTSVKSSQQVEMSSSSSARDEDDQMRAVNESSASSEQHQAHKRRLMCLWRTDSADELCKSHSDEGAKDEASDLTNLTGAPEATTKTRFESSSGSSSSSCSEDEDEQRDYSMESSPGSLQAAKPADHDEQQPHVAKQRLKKRVTFDLSNQNIETPSSSSSSEEDATLSSVSTSEGEEEDDQEQEADAEEDHEEEEAEQSSARLEAAPQISSSGPSTRPTGNEWANFGAAAAAAAAESQRFLLAPEIRQIEMRRRLELKEPLKYSRQRSNDEDEDSTCELVRRMIERRKLRLQNKETAGKVGVTQETSAAASDSPMPMSDQQHEHEHEQSATSTTEMETNEDEEQSTERTGATSAEGPKTLQTTLTKSLLEHQSAEMLNKQLELEMRLKSAAYNAELLEKRLSESYLSYSQLEMSYKQLQVELLKCRELNSQNLAQMQSKIDELTGELEASELKLLEAKERLLKYEEHLAKWQLSAAAASSNAQNQSKSTSQVHSSPPNMSRHHNSNSSNNININNNNNNNNNNNWLTRNYAMNSMLLNTNQGNKFLMNLAHNFKHHHQQRNQVSSTSSGAASGSAANQNHRTAPVLMMHQLKQTLSLNQQQLSLKLLNQSKQIQRKLNELELKVDKIQSGGSNSNLHSSNQENSCAAAATLAPTAASVNHD